MLHLMIGVCASLALGDVPGPEWDLVYDQPAMVWDEALPLGNGLLGALVWGDGSPLRISLDRTDLWDLRPVPAFERPEYNWKTMQDWERAKRYKELIDLYEDPYNEPAPTKIPAGRIELSLPGKPAFRESRLRLADGVAETTFSDGSVVRVVVAADRPVGLVEVTGNAPELSVIAPAFGGSPGKAERGIRTGDLSLLGYPTPEIREGPNSRGFTQQGWGGFRFAVAVVWTREENTWRAAWSVATGTDQQDPFDAALEQARSVLAPQAFHAALDAHKAWWKTWWDRVTVEVPDARIQKQWFLETAKFGAATRPDTPPISLQGPWTADDGKLPPWKGDYHHDLNTQLSYWPAYSGNRMDGAQGYVAWLWNNRENAEAWTRQFFDLPGLNVPMTTDLKLRQIGGWRQYTHSATTGAWLAHHFYLHWQFSRDRRFLETMAWPWIRDCAVFLEAVTADRDHQGRRSLPLSSSPEIHDNKPNAWFSVMTNYDNALMRWNFRTAAELAREMGLPEEAARWERDLSEMPEFALDEDGGLAVAEGHPLEESHRHFSHLMAIHPLGLIDPVLGGPEARKIVDQSLARLDRLGSSQWCGYSFSWLANMAAWAGDGDRAARALDIFAEAFVLRNGFHCNGDQSGKGYSSFTYRPFTLEGNFAFAAGLQEMLLQSHRGYIEVFPAIPAAWNHARFSGLRARGAFLVSAERENGQVSRIEIVSETGAVPVVRLPWNGQVVNLADATDTAGVRVQRERNRWILEPRG